MLETSPARPLPSGGTLFLCFIDRASWLQRRDIRLCRNASAVSTITWAFGTLSLSLSLSETCSRARVMVSVSLWKFLVRSSNAGTIAELSDCLPTSVPNRQRRVSQCRIYAFVMRYCVMRCRGLSRSLGAINRMLGSRFYDTNSTSDARRALPFCNVAQRLARVLRMSKSSEKRVFRRDFRATGFKQLPRRPTWRDVILNGPRNLETEFKTWNLVVRDERASAGINYRRVTTTNGEPEDGNAIELR